MKSSNNVQHWITPYGAKQMLVFYPLSDFVMVPVSMAQTSVFDLLLEGWTRD